MENIIPVIISSDNNYIKYLSVTLYSIISNGNGSFYDFYLLLSPDVTEENKNLILKLGKNFNNNKINFINMNDDFVIQKQMIKHITNPTYYRLKAANILPEKYDKCLYFDTDAIVNIDLKEYFEIDVTDYYIAGVLSAGVHFCNIHHNKLLQIPDLNQYINAGVMIMNLNKIRENNLTEEFCIVAKNNYPTVDQDVLNKCCYNYIKLLPLSYNIQTKYDLLNPTEDLLRIYPKKDIQDALQTKKIIHFADKIKPWNNFHILFADLWWKYAIKTPFAKEIFGTFIKNNVKSCLNYVNKIRLFLEIIT